MRKFCITGNGDFSLDLSRVGQLTVYEYFCVFFGYHLEYVAFRNSDGIIFSVMGSRTNGI